MLAVQQVAAGGRGLASGLRISQSMFPVTHFIVFTGLEVSRGGGHLHIPAISPALRQ
jgi:hypothetical protein